MDGNLEMSNRIVNESEKENNFWADVYYHMENHAFSEEEAIKVIQKLYQEVKNETKRDKRLHRPPKRNQPD